MLTQWKLMPHLFPANHISSLIIRDTQPFRKWRKAGQLIQKHKLFLCVSSSSYRKCLGTIFFPKHLECWVWSSHKAHTCSFENRVACAPWSVMGIIQHISPWGAWETAGRVMNTHALNVLFLNIHITSKIIWLKNSSLADCWIYLPELTVHFYS